MRAIARRSSSSWTAIRNCARPKRRSPKPKPTMPASRSASLHAQYAALGGYDARSRAARLMHGLGFAATTKRGPSARFPAGGACGSIWRRRSCADPICCCSMSRPITSTSMRCIWLEEWLRNYPGTLLMIAHDREFLDRTVESHRAHRSTAQRALYSGNYSAFEEQRAAQLAQQQSMYERQQREIRHMMSFVERFRAKASKARQAQSRLKALERMERIAPAHVDSPFEFSFLAPREAAAAVADAREAVGRLRRARRTRAQSA